MEKVKLTYVDRKERTSSRTGKPFTSLSIKTEKHGAKFLSGFGNKENANWKVGDEVEINVLQKGEYLNFEMPEKPKVGYDIAVQLARMEHNLNLIHQKVDEIHDKVYGKVVTPFEEDIPPYELPY